MKLDLVKPCCEQGIFNRTMGESTKRAMIFRITGRREDESGANTHYRIGVGSKARIVTRAEAVELVEEGKLPGYHTVRIGGVKYLRDNPDTREKDNIDNQPLIELPGLEGVIFVKLSRDRSSAYLQDTALDASSKDLHLPLIDSSVIQGAATEYIDDICVLWDEWEGKYKAWIAVRNKGKSKPWAICYTESSDLSNWTPPKPIIEGKSEPRWGCDVPGSISVLKDAENSYHMWYSIYHCPDWENMIHYRHSKDGLAWGAEKLTLRPGGVSDDGMVNAVPLKSGNVRLYYWHQEGDREPNNTRRIDVKKDGTSTSNMEEISVNPRFAAGAVIIGNRAGDTNHRIWQYISLGDVGGKGDLYLLESNDEGETWAESRIGDATPDKYFITDAFYGESVKKKKKP